MNSISDAGSSAPHSVRTTGPPVDHAAWTTRLVSPTTPLRYRTLIIGLSLVGV